MKVDIKSAIIIALVAIVGILVAKWIGTKIPVVGKFTEQI